MGIWTGLIVRLKGKVVVTAFWEINILHKLNWPLLCRAHSDGAKVRNHLAGMSFFTSIAKEVLQLSVLDSPLDQ